MAGMNKMTIKLLKIYKEMQVAFIVGNTVSENVLILKIIRLL